MVLASFATESCDSDWWRTKTWNGFGRDYHNFAKQYQGLIGDGDNPGPAHENYRKPGTTKTIEERSSGHDANKVAPKMNTVSVLDNATITSWHTNPSNPFFLNANDLTYDKGVGVKMKE